MFLSTSFLGEKYNELIMEIAVLVYLLCLSIHAVICYVAFKFETGAEKKREEKLLNIHIDNNEKENAKD